MKENTAIFLDDLNEPEDNPPGLEWYVVKNMKEFCEAIISYANKYDKMPPMISFDHDLSDEHINWAMMNLGKVPNYDDFTVPTGFHCLSWFMELCDSNNMKPQKIVIHAKGFGGTIMMDVAKEWFKKIDMPKDNVPFTMNWKFKDTKGIKTFKV